MNEIVRGAISHSIMIMENQFLPCSITESQRRELNFYDNTVFSIDIQQACTKYLIVSRSTYMQRQALDTDTLYVVARNNTGYITRVTQHPETRLLVLAFASNRFFFTAYATDHEIMMAKQVEQILAGS